MKTRSISITLLLFVTIIGSFNLIGPQLLPNIPATSQAVWSSPQVISSGSTTESWRPTVNIDTENNVQIIWEQRSVVSGPREIYHRMWNDTTRLWSSITRVSPDNNLDSRGPHSNMDELGNLFVVWWDNENSDGQGDSDINFRLWNRTTSSWGSIEVVSTESNLNGNWPAVSAKSGIAHVTWQDQANMLSDGADVDVFYKNRSTTGVWSSVELVSSVSLGSTTVSRFPSIEADVFSNVHITWDDAYNYASSGSDQDVFYRMKNGTTNSWDTTTVISSESTLYSERSKIKADQNGNLHITWLDGSSYDGSGSDTDIFYKKWDKISDIWLITEVITPESPWNDYIPSLAVDTNDFVHVVWFNGSTAGSDIKDVVYKSRSPSGSWSTSLPLKSGTGSWRPEIDIGADNRIHVVFQDGDSSYDGTDDDILYMYNTPSSITNLTIVDSSDDITYRIGKTGYSLSWILADPTTLIRTYSLVKDGIELINDTWIPYEEITYNVDGLEIGTYNYTLIASDGFGEEIQDTVFVTVREPRLNAAELQTLLEVGIGLVVAICVIGLTMTIILLRRKR
ncbi:MAG: hypothetical protein ACTSRE_11025 [Promethearchaeota archaeon]